MRVLLHWVIMILDNPNNSESGDFFAWGNIGDHWENKSSVTSPRLFSSPTPGKLTALSFGDSYAFAIIGIITCY